MPQKFLARLLGIEPPLLFKLFMEDEGMISRDAGSEVANVELMIGAYDVRVVVWQDPFQVHED